MEIPVYMINGFLESGKTKFIKTTLEDPEFINGDRILLIVCEEGEEEYDEAKFKRKNIFTVYIDSREEYTPEKLLELNAEYHPDKVIIEVNGVWNMQEILGMSMPNGWMMVQLITMVDASTFMNYINNMRSLIMEQIKYSDTVILNRCNASIKKTDVRRIIKPVNRKAQIIYESADGTDMSGEEEDELPFDVNADPIVIEDDDFGLWYLDILDFPKKYNGKNICFKAMFFRDAKMHKDTFVPGRFAMQCCANDIGFIGFSARIPSYYADFLAEHKNRDWIYVEAEIRIEFRREYKGKGPVLYVKKLEDSIRAEEEIVYFT
ncbi:MAG: GTPase [Lachnospiraceae bacterium]|nr:GTPase [Lachnospiraceae bacterium]